MVKAMKWTEIKHRIADANSRLSAVMSLCELEKSELEQKQTSKVDYIGAFKPDGGAYKDIDVVREDVEALCNYMFEDGKIDITNDLQHIQCLAKELYTKILNKTERNNFAINCWGVGKVIDDFFTQWQACNESGKNEAVVQARNTPTPKRGRQTKPFSCQMINDTDGKNLKKIHEIIKGKKGKDAILVILASIELGWLLRPNSTQFFQEFQDVECSKALYNKYINKNNNGYSQDEITGMKEALKE